MNAVRDKGFAGRDFEHLVTTGYGLHLVRPDRRDEAPRHGSIGWIPQWIESVKGITRPEVGWRAVATSVGSPAQRLRDLSTAREDGIDVPRETAWLLAEQRVEPLRGVGQPQRGSLAAEGTEFVHVPDVADVVRFWPPPWTWHHSGGASTGPRAADLM